jgi:CheY-like chemotaxis protein
MPIMDGNQTVRALRDMHARQEIDISSTKIIALSAITGE